MAGDYYNYYQPFPHVGQCPTCGHCPTCGRGGYVQPWTWPTITWGSTPAPPTNWTIQQSPPPKGEGTDEAPASS